jgi:hypothetical protein
MKPSSAAVFLALALAALPVAAKDKVEPAFNADTKDAFVTASSRVRTGMDKGGRYADVSAGERQTIDSKFTQIGALFDKSASVAQMSDAEKKQLASDQQDVNTILAKRDSERMVCKSVAPIGSHIPVKTCRTAREIAEDQHNVKQFMDDSAHVQKNTGN